VFAVKAAEYIVFGKKPDYCQGDMDRFLVVIVEELMSGELQHSAPALPKEHGESFHVKTSLILAPEHSDERKEPCSDSDSINTRERAFKPHNNGMPGNRDKSLSPPPSKEQDTAQYISSLGSPDGLIIRMLTKVSPKVQ
jgi:hypothetical protein